MYWEFRGLEEWGSHVPWWYLWAQIPICLRICDALCTPKFSIWTRIDSVLWLCPLYRPQSTIRAKRAGPICVCFLHIFVIELSACLSKRIRKYWFFCFFKLVRTQLCREAKRFTENIKLETGTKASWSRSHKGDKGTTSNCIKSIELPRYPSMLAKNLLSIARWGTLSINSSAFCKSATFSPRRAEYFTNSWSRDRERAHACD